MAEISVFDPKMIVLVDEMGSNTKCNMRAVNHVLRVGGKRLSVIAAMSVDGVEDIYTAEGNVNGGMSLRTVRTTPSLQPKQNTAW